MVSHYARLVTHLPGFDLSSTSTTNHLSINFILILVSLILGRLSRWGLTLSSQSTLLEGGITDKRDPRFMELHQN